MEEKTTSLSIKIGDAEFSAQGPAETVQEQFRAFLEILETAPKRPDARGAKGTDTAAETPPTPPEEIPQSLLSRVFAKDAADRVSLKVLPRSGAADALLLLLYGFEEIAGEHSVTGSALMKAAEKSGAGVDRIDRTIDETLVTAAGARRAKRYGLNNRGKQRAREIIHAILD